MCGFIGPDLFQILIGILKARIDGFGTFFFFVFQILIGILKAHSDNTTILSRCRFQILIGILKAVSRRQGT